MTRKATWMFAVIVAAAVFAPQAVLAAVSSFSSSATPAVSGNNTMSGTNLAPGGKFTCKANGCRAVWAESNGTSNGSYGVYASAKDPKGRGLNGLNTATTGTAIGLGGQSNSVTGRALNGLALSSTGANFGGFMETKSGSTNAVGAFGWASNKNATGTNFGVYGKNDGKGMNASGVFGEATAVGPCSPDCPAVNGVFGRALSSNGSGLFGQGGAYGFFGAGGWAGGYGDGQTYGIVGTSPEIGDGSYGLASFTDAAVGGHLYGKTGNLAGTCTVPSGANSSGICTFANPFSTAPIVVMTAAQATTPGDGREYWISATTTTGFTITRDSTSGGEVNFNWVAIGLDDVLDTLGPARTGPTRTAAFSK